MLNTEIYDFIKDNFSKENFKSKLLENFRFSVMGCRNYRKGKNPILQQQPDELLGLINLLKDKNISSYMEIGLGTCNTIFFLDSFFRSMNDDYQETIGIDIEDKSELFKEYQKQFNTCSFLNINILKYSFNKSFDYIFIDTNQKYKDMEKTFNKCLPYATKYIGFHDISTSRWGAKKLFSELSEKYENWSWSKSGAGIGVLKVK